MRSGRWKLCTKYAMLIVVIGLTGCGGYYTGEIAGYIVSFR